MSYKPTEKNTVNKREKCPAFQKPTILGPLSIIPFVIDHKDAAFLFCVVFVPL